MDQQRYKNLADLMLNNHAAQAFFDKLPDDLKRNISRDGKGIQSLNQLEEFANHHLIH
ncbi:MAG: hypothetical protein R3Y53_07830 [Bacillota bacterium]